VIVSSVHPSGSHACDTSVALGALPAPGDGSDGEGTDTRTGGGTEVEPAPEADEPDLAETGGNSNTPCLIGGGPGLLAVWREATVFTEAERAALELTEQGTRIADAAGGVTDEAWADAAKHYDEEQLTALVSLIAIINSFNRLNVIIRQPAGDYQPGQFR
jgi:hypothetical protein